MSDILHGALFKNVDVEMKMKKAMAEIMFEEGIGEHRMDKVFVPRLKFLNALCGLKFIRSGKTYSRYFEQRTSHFNIYEIESGPNFGSYFDLRQSVDMDFSNVEAHACMTFYKIRGTNGTPFCPQFLMADGYDVEGRMHVKLTNVQRINGGFVDLLQNPKYSKAEVIH